MKKFYLLAIFCFLLSLTTSVKGQTGYVLLNEYMPWTTNTCTVNGEFIELYNFGPGPMDLGCYSITDGDFSITFPPNTIINAGQFFVLGGKDTIPNGCANISAPVVVDLNWSTCNCTSGAIPTTGDGFLTDGGSASEQVVLFDPNLKVVDAVVRKLPAETSSAITTKSMTGACVAKTFDLDTMTIDYETIGQSAGRGNSFARKLDGDCGWEKDPQQSGGATNNTSGSVASLTSVLNITNANACSNNGSISINFTGVSDYSTIFPVEYILAKDLDSNTVFDLSDLYVNGVDSTSPSVDIGGLSPGYYEIALQPKSGCNYQFYQFTILPCNTVLLEPNTFYFYGKRNDDKTVQLTWTAGKIERTQKFEIERSADGINFKKVQSFTVQSKTQSLQNYKFYDLNSLTITSYYRIKIYYTNNTITYSPVKKIEGIEGETNTVTLFPNPVVNVLNMNFQSKSTQDIIVMLLQTDGKSLRQKRAHVNMGYNKFQMETGDIQRGLYFVKVYNQDGSATVKKVYKQ